MGTDDVTQMPVPGPRSIKDQFGCPRIDVHVGPKNPLRPVHHRCPFSNYFFLRVRLVRNRWLELAPLERRKGHLAA